MSWNPLRKARDKREAELDALDRWRIARRVADEDVTVLGEQLADLHLDTLADPARRPDVAPLRTCPRALRAGQGRGARLHHGGGRVRRGAGRGRRALPPRRRAGPAGGGPIAPASRPVLLRPAPRPEHAGHDLGAPVRRRAHGVRVRGRRPAASRVARPPRSGWCGWATGTSRPTRRVGSRRSSTGTATMRDERPESHNRKNLAEAYIDQAINGPDGRFG